MFKPKEPRLYKQSRTEYNQRPLVLPAGLVTKQCARCHVPASKRRVVELNEETICSICAEMDGQLAEWRVALQMAGTPKEPKQPTPKPQTFGGWS